MFPIEVLNYILNEYKTNNINERISINIQLSSNGRIQNAIGSCFTKTPQQITNQTNNLRIYTGNKPNNEYRKYKFETDGTKVTHENEAFLEHSFYTSFIFKESEENVEDIFFKIKLFCKETAAQYPNIKLSLTGDDTLLEYKCVKMIEHSLNDLLKYECENVRLEVQTLLGVEDKQQVLDFVSKKLTNKLKEIND